MKKFKKKYILGEGYPWPMGIGPSFKSFKEIAMSETQQGFKPIVLEWANEFWDKEVPRYRLILELVKEK